MGCINYGTTPVEVEQVDQVDPIEIEKREAAKKRAKLEGENQELPCNDTGDVCKKEF